MGRNLLIVSCNMLQLDKLSELTKEITEETNIYRAESAALAYGLLLDNTIDVFLIDVTLTENLPGDTSGLCLAAGIRRIPQYMLSPIILIAPVEDPALYAYSELNCLGYVKRPYEPELVKSILGKALRYRTPRPEDRWIVFRERGRLYPVKVAELVCIMNENHILKVYLYNGEVREMAYKSMSALLQEADLDCLFQCSRSAVVNKNYIEHIDITGHCIRLTGKRGNINIGFTYRKKVTEIFGSE